MESADLPDGLALFDPDRNVVHHLNPTATLIWELCDGRSEADIIQQVSLILEIDEEASEEYVRSGLELFRSQNILE